MHTWQDARSLNLFKHLCTTEPSIVPMPPISYIRWSLSLTCSSPYLPVPEACISLWLSLPRRSASRTEESKRSYVEERCRGLCYRWSREGRTDSRGMLPWRGPPAGASNAPAPTGRPSWQHYTTPHYMRGEEASNFKCPLRVVTTRHLPIFRSQKQWPGEVGQCDRRSAKCQEECQCRA